MVKGFSSNLLQRRTVDPCQFKLHMTAQYAGSSTGDRSRFIQTRSRTSVVFTLTRDLLSALSGALRRAANHRCIRFFQAHLPAQSLLERFDCGGFSERSLACAARLTRWPSRHIRQPTRESVTPSYPMLRSTFGSSSHADVRCSLSIILYQDPDDFFPLLLSVPSGDP